MKIYDFNTLPSDSGLGIFLYGSTGVGKSINCLWTAPAPIFYFLGENRDPKRFIATTKRRELEDGQNFRAAFYEGWEDLIDFFATRQKHLARFSTIIIDGFTHLCSMSLAFEITEESWDARDKSKVTKDLASRSKMTMENYGVLERHLMRFTDLILQYVKMGKIVIVLSLMEDHPTFNRSLAAAPALMGKAYGQKFPGEFDLIGYVEPRPIEEGKKYPSWMRQTENLVYPPLVNFDSPEGNFMAKWTGVEPFGNPKPLHIGKLITLSNMGTVDWRGDEPKQEKEVKEVKEIKEEPKEEVKEEVKEEAKQDEFD